MRAHFPPRIRALAAGLAVLSALALARAHDDREITAEAWIRGGKIELTLTMARSTAARLLAGGADAAAFAPAEFTVVRGRLVAAAPGFVDIGPSGRALRPRQVQVSLSVEDDVEFSLVYMRPPGRSVRFRTAAVEVLPDGFGVDLMVLAPNLLLGQKLLVRGDASLEVPLPPAGK